MSIKVQLKHSAVKDKAPVAADLSNGELALNINDQSPAAYIKDSAGNIVKIAGAGAVGDDWTRTGTELSPATAGDSVFTTGAVKVGGATAAPNTELNADGSATFAGDVKIGETVPPSPNISLHAAGHATFTGETDEFTKIFPGGETRITFKGYHNPGDECGLLWVQQNAAATQFRFSKVNCDPEDGWKFYATNGTNFNGSETPVISLSRAGGATFNGTVTAANVTSDIRFKENISTASSQLDDVKQLAALLKNWDWNDQAPMNDEIRSQRFLGLVAQEAEKVCPHITYTVPRTKYGKELTPAVLDDDGAVVTEGTYEELDDSYKALKHDVILMKLLGAVGELIAKNEQLEAEVAALKAH